MVAWIALALALANLAVFAALIVAVRVLIRRRPALEPWLALLAPASPVSPPAAPVSGSAQGSAQQSGGRRG